jgi:hypothetical protein
MLSRIKDHKYIVPLCVGFNFGFSYTIAIRTIDVIINLFAKFCRSEKISISDISYRDILYHSINVGVATCMLKLLNVYQINNYNFSLPISKTMHLFEHIYRYICCISMNTNRSDISSVICGFPILCYNIQNEIQKDKNDESNVDNVNDENAEDAEDAEDAESDVDNESNVDKENDENAEEVNQYFKSKKYNEQNKNKDLCIKESDIECEFEDCGIKKIKKRHFHKRNKIVILNENEFYCNKCKEIVKLSYKTKSGSEIICEHCPECCKTYSYSITNNFKTNINYIEAHCYECHVTYNEKDNEHCIICHKTYKKNEKHCDICHATTCGDDQICHIDCDICSSIYNPLLYFHCNKCHSSYNNKYKNCPNCNEISSNEHDKCILCFDPLNQNEKNSEKSDSDDESVLFRNKYMRSSDIGTLSHNKNTIKIECGHEFHKECIDNWIKINHSCPLCKIGFE